MLTFALKNLSRRKTRTILTVLGISIAIGATFVLFSVSEGTQEIIASAKKLGPDIEVKKTTGDSQIGRGGYLDENYADVLNRINGVRKSAPIIMTQAAAIDGKGFMILVAISPRDAREIYRDTKVAVGRSLTENDNFVMVLGSQAAKLSSLSVGDNFPIRNENFEIIGILAETGGIIDLVAEIPLSAFQLAMGARNKASSIWLWVEDGVDIKTVISEIENKYSELEATEGITILKQTEDFMKFGDAIRLTIAGIALLIGALAAMNTVTMSAFERTREFGAMRSLGASSGYVFKLILVESTLLCIIGGVLGCLVGYAGAAIMEHFILDYIGMDVVATTLKIPLIAIGIATAVGLIAGIYPAWRVSKQQIVEALRYE